MLYLVQRTDCDSFAVARDLDPGYGAAFDTALERGVEAICHGTVISTKDVVMSTELPVSRC